MIDVRRGENSAQVGAQAAMHIAVQLRRTVDSAGAAVLALSGGSTPAAALTILAQLSVPWSKVHVMQVDERVVDHESTDRNLSMLYSTLLDHVNPASVLAMPVDAEQLEESAACYATTVARVAGSPMQIDVAVLGLGDDGHTASLIPGDLVLSSAAEVAVAAPYRGYRRMTLTVDPIRRAHHRVFIVTGQAKQNALARLIEGVSTDPASLVIAEPTVVFADTDAAP